MSGEGSPKGEKPRKAGKDAVKAPNAGKDAGNSRIAGKTDVRSLALASLVRWRADGKYANLEVAASLGRADLSDKD